MVITGLVTFRAYRKFDFYRIQFMESIEKSANATFCYYLVNRWVGIRLDSICVIFSVSTAAFCIGFKDIPGIDRSLLTFSMQIVADIIAMFSVSIRMFAEVENYMTSSQRIIEYTKIESEDLLEKPNDTELKKIDWPKQGIVEFKNITMRYRKHMDPSVIDLSCTVQDGMKVGIVGRTGAGKSSILQILFRLSDSDEGGKLLIDGVDCKDIGLHLLRKNIAYIPQSPFLIQGSIRENLDPFNDYTDELINKTLEEVKLLEYITTQCSNGIYTLIAENNNVFSVGQKQLLCLGRAIIRKTKMLVLDEATANVDLETDNFIQEKLKSSFKGCTVMIIAHRLATVIDSDRILVMHKGEAMEFDHPFKLLTNDEQDSEITKTNEDGSEGYFAKMVKATGDETAKQLFEIA